MSHPQTVAEANRRHWDADAERYHAEHVSYLDGFHWCPEMLAESEARLLGDVTDASVLEIGCGSAPCARWLASDGVGFVAGFDISRRMLERAGHTTVGLVQADASVLPFQDDSFDVAFSAFGALPFVADIGSVFVDISRVLRPGGRLVFSVNHPMRWVFPDDPGPAGLQAQIPYFDREYLEYSGDTLVYAEFHRTFGDWVSALTTAGFSLDRILEPEWPERLTETWGQWSPLRGRIFPGTAIFCASLPAAIPASR